MEGSSKHGIKGKRIIERYQGKRVNDIHFCSLVLLRCLPLLHYMTRDPEICMMDIPPSLKMNQEHQILIILTFTVTC